MQTNMTNEQIQDSRERYLLAADHYTEQFSRLGEFQSFGIDGEGDDVELIETSEGVYDVV